MVRNTDPEPYRDLRPDDWWHPEMLPADTDLRPGQPLLTEEQVSRFRNDGFLVVTSLWPQALIDRAVAEARALHPAGDVAARGGAEGFSEMPWSERGDGAEETALNQMTIHPRALAAVSQLLGTDPLKLRLSQSHVRAKFGHQVDCPSDPAHGSITGDQDIHVDYGNNTLLGAPRISQKRCPENSPRTSLRTSTHQIPVPARQALQPPALARPRTPSVSTARRGRCTTSREPAFSTF